MRVLRTGITRTVLLTRRYAIKVPSLRGGSSGGTRGRLQSFCWGVLANVSERQWHGFAGWNGAVAPVLHSWLAGIVQIYPRCAPLPVDEHGVFDGDLPELDPNPGDPKPDNFGILAGRIVRIDYDMG
jgi:hypothetical protein